MCIDKDILSLLEQAECMDEGRLILVCNADLVNSDVADAILDISKGCKGGRAELFALWHKDARAIALLNDYFHLITEDREKAGAFLASIGQEDACTAIDVLLFSARRQYYLMDRSRSEADALVRNLGIDSAEDRKKGFEDHYQQGDGFVRMARIIADKCHVSRQYDQIWIWDGLIALSGRDKLRIFKENGGDELRHRAVDDFEQIIASSTDPMLRIRCYMQLSEAWQDVDLEKSLDCLYKGKSELDGRIEEASTGEEKSELDSLRYMLIARFSPLLQKTGRFREAYDMLLPAIESLEKKLWRLMAPNLIADFLEANGGFYADMVATCMELGKSDRMYKIKALEYAEKINSRMFLESRKTTFTIDDHTDPSLVMRRQKLLEELEYVGTDASGDDLDRLNGIMTEIGMVEQEIWERSKNKIFYFDARPATLKEITGLVPQEGILAEYFVAGDRIFAFVVDDHDLVDAVEIEFDHSELWQIIMMADLAIGCRLDYTAYNELHGMGIDLPWDQLINLRFLYGLLVDPIKKYMAGKEILYLIPGGVLRKVPFNALYRDTADGKKYLLEEIAICYAPSASILRLLRERNNALKTCLALGVAEEKGGPKNAFEEARSVTRRFGTEALHGTRETLLQAKDGYDILHISCHSSEDNPVSTFNGLVLEDGTLLQKDIGEVGCSLVTLSACRTFSDDTGERREMAGLTGRFLFAGARSVVASLWPVHTDATNMLMERFYEGLTHGESKAKALQEGQVKVMKSFSDHPLFWAPFMLVGTHD